MGRRYRLVAFAVIAMVMVAYLASCTRAAVAVDLPPSPVSAHPKTGQSLEQRLAAHVAYLAGEDCEGRLVGTTGDKKTASYLVDELRTMGVSPLWKSSYLQEFGVNLADVDATLDIIDDDGSVAKSFTYFDDFCEILYPNWGMNTAEGLISVVDLESGPSLPEGSVAVARLPSDGMQALMVYAASSKCSAVVICDESLALDSIPVKYMNREPAGVPFPVFLVHPRCYNELADREGSKVRLTVISEGIPSVFGWNVAGVIGNPVKQPTVVICAHRDHMGMLDDGTMFPGAIDNASGVSVVLELARQVKETGIDIAVVFLFTDGEEVSLDGARYFAANLPFPAKNLVGVLNLDCVGVSGQDSMVLNAGGGDTAYALADAVVVALHEEGIPAAVVDEALASDHQAFEAAGIPAVGLLSSIESFESRLHNRTDTEDGVDPDELAALTRALYTALLAGATN